MDGWSNNSAYTSSGTSGGFSNNGSSATSNGYGGSSSNYSNSSSDDSAYWSGVYGGSSNSSNSGNSVATGISSSSAPAAIQSKVEAKVDAKNPTNNDGQPGSLTGQGLAGPTTAPKADYWSGAVDGWRNNSRYADGLAGQFGSEPAMTNLNNAIASGKAHEGQIDTAKAISAATNAVRAREAVGGLTGAIGGAIAGPLGGAALGKAGGWGAETLNDLTSGYKDNPAYQKAKELASDDSSFLASMASQFSPVPGVGGMLKVAINDKTGGFRQQEADLRQSMIKQGYVSPQSNIQRSGSSSVNAPNSLLANMYQTQQPADAYSYEQPSLNYDNNATYYRGSVI